MRPEWRVLKGSQFYLPPTRLPTNGMSHPAFTPSRRASPPFGRYLFPVPQQVGGWVGLKEADCGNKGGPGLGTAQP